jgi:hypothetical protein
VGKEQPQVERYRKPRELYEATSGGSPRDQGRASITPAVYETHTGNKNEENGLSKNQ